MSKIQVIRRTYKGNANSERIFYSTISSPRALDDFDINIIDLNDEYLWVNRDHRIDNSDYSHDFKSISDMIENSVTAKIIVLLPQNCKFRYDYWPSDRGYRESLYLKDMISNMMGIIETLSAEIYCCELIYENTITTIDNLRAKAAFSFKTKSAVEVTKSDKSNRMTTILANKIYFSSLSLETEEMLFAFLREIGLIKEKESAPEWFKDIEMFNDAEIKAENHDIDNRIETLVKQKNENQEVLKENNRYKSILYSNGSELVEVVFEIFEEMLGCDLSGFIDVNKEDFLFEINNKKYIGEIKGVNTNVRSEYISQLDVHVNSYLDENPDSSLEDIVALLVINDQKKKPLQEREPVHDNQIALARRNGSLIIQTNKLLDMFSKYKQGELDREGVIEMLNCKGLL